MYVTPSIALWSSGHVCQRFLRQLFSILVLASASTPAVVPAGGGWTTPLSGFVVPMIVVFVFILLIITLFEGVVDDALIKLLVFDILLLLWCAADDVRPLASVAFVLRLNIGGGKFCPLASTTDGGGFGESIGDSCTWIFKWCWSVWKGRGRSSIRSKLCILLCDRCKCKWWWWWSRWCGETFVDWPIFGLPWRRQPPILMVSRFLLGRKIKFSDFNLRPSLKRIVSECRLKCKGVGTWII